MIQSGTVQVRRRIGALVPFSGTGSGINAGKLQKRSAVVGLIAPIYFFTLVGILEKMWTGYNPISQYVSVLGSAGSPYQNIFNVLGFMGLGIMLLIFSAGFHLYFNKSTFMKLALLCLIVAGSSLIAIGLFPCDFQCVNTTEIGKLHSIISIPPIALPLASIFFAQGIMIYKGWGKNWQMLSLILGFGAITAGSSLLVSSLHPFIGFIQRIGATLCLLWVFCVSTKLLKDNYA